MSVSSSKLWNKPLIIKAHAWKGDTHSFIMQKAVDILGKDGFEEAFDFFASYGSLMMSCVNMPDRSGDTDKGKGFHYYCAKCVNGTDAVLLDSGYYRAGKNLLDTASYSRSARTIFEDDYQSALSFFRNGEFERAIEFASRCVHMISDVCCTPHTTDLTLTSKYNSRHKKYEFYAKDVYEKYGVDKCSDDIYVNWLGREFLGEIFNELAQLSAKYYDDVVFHNENARLDAVIESCLAYAQMNSAAFLLRLFNEFNNADSGLACERKYRLKSISQGGYLSLSDKSSSGFKLADSEDDNSVFRLSLNNNGSYLFEYSEGAVKLSLMKKKNIGIDAYSFKIGRTPTGYRLLTAPSGYSRAVDVSASGCICTSAYNPDRMSQCWIFEEV